MAWGEDCKRFNVVNADGEFLCPACGWPGYFDGSSYGVAGSHIATGICPCCTFEPGFDDDLGASSAALSTVKASIKDFRKRWIISGMRWAGRQPTPTAPRDWDPKAQLARLFVIAPDLA